VFTVIFTKINFSWDRELIFDVSKELSGSAFRVVTEETASAII
jgi:hypothetical protein